jgi:hypothetical protein
MIWMLASLRDHDTHLAADREGAVDGQCGIEFHPLVKLKGTPLDPLQICPGCAEWQQARAASAGRREAVGAPLGWRLRTGGRVRGGR